MRLRPPHSLPQAGRINVTPLIDVVMVLIVFYLIVGNLARSSLPAVALPASATGREEATAPLTITVVSRAGGARVVVDGVEIAPEDLPDLVRARVPDPSKADVHLRADRALAYSQVAPVIQACRESGLTSVRLVAVRGSGR
jgi:biopolymer transport protein ExbD